MRFELTRANAHYPLKVACLPIPPPGHTVSRLSSWCPEQDSNLHASRHTHLKRARLPIPPPGHLLFIDRDTDGAKNGTRTRDPNLGKVVLYQLSYFRISSFQSLFGTLSDGRAKNGTRTRDPNLGKVVLYQLSYFRNCECKDKRTFRFMQALRRFFHQTFFKKLIIV